MIVRIATEGQYKLDGTALAELDRIDDAMLDAVTAGKAAEFTALLRAVVDLVRSKGHRVPDAELAASDLILPAPDTTLAEAQEILASYPRQLT